MKKSISILASFVLFFQLSTLSQTNYIRCGTDEAVEQNLVSDSQIEDWLEAERAWQNYTPTTRQDQCEVFTIPIVVHVVFSDANTNIPDERILSQIEVLNEDYRRIAGTPGEGNGVDMRVQFCLAGLNPNGDATTGITRTFSPLGDHVIDRDVALKSLISWDTKRYLNVWVVSKISQDNSNADEELLAYSFLPGSVADERMGIVIGAKFIGRNGTAPPYNRGRTLTHEVGHYLGLFHTFGQRDFEGCLGSGAQDCRFFGDRICDTPAESEPKYGCPSPINSCIDGVCDRNDGIKNYMGYVDDACMGEFTKGQRERIRFFLSQSDFLPYQVSQASNLEITGCSNVSAITSPPVAAIESSTRSICEGESILFIPNEDICADNYQWSFPGASPATSTEVTPNIRFTQSGSYDVELIVSKEGLSDTLYLEDYVSVSSGSSIRDLTESFEQNQLNEEIWHQFRKQELPLWDITNQASSTGSRSLHFSQFGNQGICTDHQLILSGIDLSGTQSAILDLDYSYQALRSESGYADSLLIRISSDCGQSFPDTLWVAGGVDLATKQGFLSDQAFVPLSSNWQSLNLDLSPWTGIQDLRILFQAKSKGAQDIYLDNINVQSTLTSLDEQIDKKYRWKVSPNPTDKDFNISLELEQKSEIQLMLMDIHGRKLWQSPIQFPSQGSHEWQIPESPDFSFPRGVYFLNLSIDGKNIWKRLIKH